MSLAFDANSSPAPRLTVRNRRRFLGEMLVAQGIISP